MSDDHLTQRLNTEGADLLTLAGVNDANLDRAVAHHGRARVASWRLAVAHRARATQSSARRRSRSA